MARNEISNLPFKVAYLAAIMISLTILQSAQAQEFFRVVSTEITVFSDGVARIDQEIEVDTSIPSIDVRPLAADPTNVLALSGAKLPLSTEIKNGQIIVDTVGANRVILTYETQLLTKKDGLIWTFLLENPYNLTVYLPPRSTIIYLSEIPPAITFNNGKPSLFLTEKKWEISYTLTITRITQTQTVAISPTEAESTTTRTTTSQTAMATQDTGPNFFSVLIPTGSIVGVAAIAALYTINRRTKGIVRYVELTEEEKRVLNFMAERGGKVLETEIRQNFLIPKTTAWRIMRKLERLGYLKTRRVGGQNELALVKGPNQQS